MKNIKERLKNGEMVFGTWNNIPSASLMNAVGCSGIDFIVIDAEHGPISMETAEDLIRAAEVCGVAPIIRVSSNSDYLILRALDIGAHGIQVPHISTKEEASRVVQYSKYYPLGERGYSPFTRAGKYGYEPKEHAKRSNEDTLIVINIEGKEGIRNLKDIVETDNIDVVFIGPYDLSQSLGKPGKVDDKEVINSIRNSVKIIKDKGLACGSFANDLTYLDILMDCGVQYLTYMVDSSLITETYRNLQMLFTKKKKEKNR